MNIKVREQIKVLLTQEQISMKDFAEMMQNATGKLYTLQTISHRLKRGTFTYNEVLVAAELLGYKISFTKI